MRQLDITFVSTYLHLIFRQRSVHLFALSGTQAFHLVHLNFRLPLCSIASFFSTSPINFGGFRLAKFAVPFSFSASDLSTGGRSSAILNLNISSTLRDRRLGEATASLCPPLSRLLIGYKQPAIAVVVDGSVSGPGTRGCWNDASSETQRDQKRGIGSMLKRLRNPYARKLTKGMGKGSWGRRSWIRPDARWPCSWRAPYWTALNR